MQMDSPLARGSDAPSPASTLKAITSIADQHIAKNSHQNADSTHIQPLALTDNHSHSGTFIPGTSRDFTINVDGHQRSYSVHTPKDWDGKSKLPVLYYFNGMNPNHQESESFTGLNQVADKNHCLVVYMHGTGSLHAYNNGQHLFQISGATQNENDYLNAVHNQLQKELPVDSSRQGLAGFSQGGNEAYVLTAQNKWVSSVQTVESYFSGLEGPLKRSVSEQSIHAVNDPIVPIDGSNTSITGKNVESTALSVIDKVAAAVDHDVMLPSSAITQAYLNADHINGRAVVSHSGDGVISDYTNPQTHAEVTSVVLTNPYATHGWAGSTDHSGDIKDIGMPDKDFNASNAVIDFFLKHPLGH